MSLLFRSTDSLISYLKGDSRFLEDRESSLLSPEKKVTEYFLSTKNSSAKPTLNGCLPQMTGYGPLLIDIRVPTTTSLTTQPALLPSLVVVIIIKMIKPQLAADLNACYLFWRRSVVFFVERRRTSKSSKVQMSSWGTTGERPLKVPEGKAESLFKIYHSAEDFADGHNYRPQRLRKRRAAGDGSHHKVHRRSPSTLSGAVDWILSNPTHSWLLILLIKWGNWSPGSILRIEYSPSILHAH